MLGNIGNLFVKCMDKSQKAWVSDYYVIYKQRAQFCGMPATVTNLVTDPFRWFCELLVRVCGEREGILTSPLILAPLFSAIRWSCSQQSLRSVGG